MSLWERQRLKELISWVISWVSDNRESESNVAGICWKELVGGHAWSSLYTGSRQMWVLWGLKLYKWVAWKPSFSSRALAKEAVLRHLGEKRFGKLEQTYWKECLSCLPTTPLGDIRNNRPQKLQGCRLGPQWPRDKSSHNWSIYLALFVLVESIWVMFSFNSNKIVVKRHSP